MESMPGVGEAGGEEVVAVGIVGGAVEEIGEEGGTLVVEGPMEEIRLIG
jgi:hypothetical protein